MGSKIFFLLMQHRNRLLDEFVDSAVWSACYVLSYKLFKLRIKLNSHGSSLP